MGTRLAHRVGGDPQVTDEPVFTIGDAAHYTGVSIDTIRRWEKDGVTKPATRNATKQRRYTQHDLDHLRTIAHERR